MLFDLCIDDLKDKWERKNEGGVVTGKEKIFAIKYANYVAAIAETGEGLNCILKDLKNWAQDYKMEINAKKTKIMIFRNGGRVKKEEKWEIKGEKVQIVKEFKYLGYWFTCKNSIWAHGKKRVEKTQKATNMMWGIWRRAGKDVMEDRLYLLDSILKARAIYGVEIWRMEDISMFERIQSKYCKMALGVDRTTPSYIWRRELGVPTLEYLIRERALRL